MGPTSLVLKNAIQAKTSIMNAVPPCSTPHEIQGGAAFTCVLPTGVRSLVVDAGLLFRTDHFPPGMVRIERGHARADPLGPWPEILFVNVAIIVDDERHDAGITILGGIGDEAEATNHVAAHDVIYRAARGVWTLAGQDLVAISVIWFPGADAIASLRCVRDRFA